MIIKHEKTNDFVFLFPTENQEIIDFCKARKKDTENFIKELKDKALQEMTSTIGDVDCIIIFDTVNSKIHLIHLPGSEGWNFTNTVIQNLAQNKNMKEESI